MLAEQVVNGKMAKGNDVKDRWPSIDQMNWGWYENEKFDTEENKRGWKKSILEALLSNWEFYFPKEDNHVVNQDTVQSDEWDIYD